MIARHIVRIERLGVAELRHEPSYFSWAVARRFQLSGRLCWTWGISRAERVRLSTIEVEHNCIKIRWRCRATTRLACGTR
jgi:hypothetical protein